MKIIKKGIALCGKGIGYCVRKVSWSSLQPPSQQTPPQTPPRLSQNDIWKMWTSHDPPESELIVRRGGQIINNDPQGYHKWEGHTDNKFGATANVFAASCRGRSHAHNKKFRDDSFDIRYIDESGWYVLAVADGAGSAKYSRKGSEIACRISADIIETKIKKGEFNEEFDADCEKIRKDSYGVTCKKSVEKFCGKHLYHILAEACVNARNAILEEVNAMNQTPDQRVSERDYHTTILLTICKKLQNSEWFIGSFGIGDGMIAYYSPGSRDLMTVTDCGDYAGETTFLTTNQVWDVSDDPNKIIRRFKAVVVPDFTALFLMTDGVSDAIFPTEAMLDDSNTWDEFWKKLTKGEENSFSQVDFQSETAAQQLLEWLEFKVPGYHDDRTLIVLQPNK